MFNTPAVPVVKPGGYVVLKARMGHRRSVSLTELHLLTSWTGYLEDQIATDSRRQT